MKNIKKFFSVLLFVCLTALSSYAKDNSDIINKDLIKQMVKSWSEAHNSKDVGIFSNLFDSSIYFYGTELKKMIVSEISFLFLKNILIFIKKYMVILK